MPATLIRKLEQFKKLSPEQKQVLQDAISDVVDYGPGEDIIGHGDRPDPLHLLLEGWAGRYKLLPEGDRHIMAYLIPGDIGDLHAALLGRMDHSIGALSRCKVAFIPQAVVAGIIDQNNGLAKALWWSSLVDEAISREWLVTMGARPADKRIAHLISEMFLRTKAVGLADGDSFEMPVTQEELGDTMGLTNVHVNRMLQQLRGDGLISTQGRRVTVHDFDALMQFADFDPLYLHQQGERVLNSK